MMGLLSVKARYETSERAFSDSKLLEFVLIMYCIFLFHA